MAAEEWVTDEVEVFISGLFTTEHRLETSGEPLGKLTIPAFRRDSTFRTAEGRALRMRQTAWWKSEYELREGEAVLGVAYARGLFRSRIVVEFGGRTYMLGRGRWMSGEWLLSDEGGNELLGIRSRGVFRRGARLRILAELPVELMAFAYYLIYQQWQTEAAAVAV